MAEKLIAELRRRYPALAKRAERGPMAAVRLFCLECMGGERTAPAGCTTTDCALWPFRTGHGFRGAGLQPAPETTQEAR